MKKHLLSVLLAAFSLFSVCAQVTISNYEFFQVGDSGHYIIPSDTIKTIGQAGANRTWDYSTLAPSNSFYSVKIVSPASTPYQSSFSNANIAEKNSDSTYNFIKVSADTSSVYGQYSPSYGLYVSPTPYVSAIRPISYLDSFSSSGTHQYTVSGYTYHGATKAKGLADGYGTLKLPNGTYNDVLRITLDIVEYDTTTGLTGYTHVKTYTWFDAAHHFSLLKIDSTYSAYGSYISTTTDVKYLSGETLGIAPVSENMPGIKLYQLQNSLYITNPDNAVSVHIDIVGAEGKILLQKDISHPIANQLVADISFLKTGIYLARVYSGGQQSVLKFFKE